MTLPGWLDPAIVGASALIALIFVAAGALRVVRLAGDLRKRVEAYADLPIFRQIELAQARIAIAEGQLATAPQLVTRVQRALQTIDESRAQLQRSAATVTVAGRLVKALWDATR